MTIIAVDTIIIDFKDKCYLIQPQMLYATIDNFVSYASRKLGSLHSLYSTTSELSDDGVYGAQLVQAFGFPLVLLREEYILLPV